MLKFNDFDRAEYGEGLRRTPGKLKDRAGIVSLGGNLPKEVGTSKDVWAHVKYNEQGINQPWYFRLLQARKRSK